MCEREKQGDSHNRPGGRLRCCYRRGRLAETRGRPLARLLRNRVTTSESS